MYDNLSLKRESRLIRGMIYVNVEFGESWKGDRWFFYFHFHFWQVDLRHIDEIRGKNVVDIGVDLSEFYTSVEWDILEVPAVR